MKIYLVMSAISVTDKPVAAFAELEEARDFIEHGRHLDVISAKTAMIVEMDLLFGQHLWAYHSARTIAS